MGIILEVKIQLCHRSLQSVCQMWRPGGVCIKHLTVLAEWQDVFSHDRTLVTAAHQISKRIASDSTQLDSIICQKVTHAGTRGWRLTFKNELRVQAVAARAQLQLLPKSSNAAQTQKHSSNKRSTFYPQNAVWANEQRCKHDPQGWDECALAYMEGLSNPQWCRPWRTLRLYQTLKWVSKEKIVSLKRRQ